MPSRARQIEDKHPSETEVGLADFGPSLRSGELLTGTPTTSVSPTGPTISNVGVTVADETIRGVSVGTGEGVIFSIAGGTDSTDYDITITATTDGTPARTLILICPWRCTIK